MNSFIESSDIKSHMKTSRNEYMKEKQKRSTLKSFVKNQEQICKTNLQIYNDSLKKDNLQYGDMKQTLKTFLMGYEHILIQKEKEKAQIKDTKYSTPFTELVNQYSQKGYKIPNLSRHHNLFKPSIILTDNKKTIDRYFKEAKKNKKNFLNNKEYKYMDKLDECVHIKLREGARGGFFSNLDHHSSNFSFNTYEVSEENEKVSPLVKMENERKQKKLIKKENEELQKYNDIISNCINDYEKEWGSNNNTITINSNNNGNVTTKHVSPFKKKNNVTTPSSTRHVLFKRSFTKEFNYNTHANTNNNNNNINSSTHNKTAMTVSKYVNNSIARTNIIKPNINEQVFHFKINIKQYEEKDNICKAKIEEEDGDGDELLLQTELLNNARQNDNKLNIRLLHSKMNSFSLNAKLKETYHDNPLSAYSLVNYKSFYNKQSLYENNKQKYTNVNNNSCSYIKNNFDYNDYLKMRHSLSNFNKIQAKKLQSSQSCSNIKRSTMLSESDVHKDKDNCRNRRKSVEQKNEDNSLNYNSVSFNLKNIENAFVMPDVRTFYPKYFLPRSSSGLLKMPADMLKGLKKKDKKKKK